MAKRVRRLCSHGSMGGLYARKTEHGCKESLLRNMNFAQWPHCPFFVTWQGSMSKERKMVNVTNSEDDHVRGRSGAFQAKIKRSN